MRLTVPLLALGLLLVGAPLAAAQSDAASTGYERWKSLFDTVLYAAIVVGVLVEGALVYALIRFRARKGGPKEGPHIHGNTRLEIMWTIAPAIVMGWLLLISYNGLIEADTPPRNPPDFYVDVEAAQFSFKFTYPDGSVANNGTLRVEEDSLVILNVTSIDVIHALSAHELAIMIDAVPGRTNQVWFQPTRAGEYEIRCRELCGVGHSRMGGTLIVFPDDGDGVKEYGFPKAPTPTTPATSPSDTTATSPTDTTDTGAPPATKTIQVALSPGLRINPAEILDQIQPGETVRFEVKNEDGTTHDLFVGEGYDASKPNNGAEWFTDPALGGGESASLVVTFPSEDKTFQMWCNQPGHFQGGMKGEIAVGKGSGGIAEKEPILPGFEPFLVLAALVGVVVLLRRRR